MEILIADDSAVSRRLLGAVLEKWGFEVTTASSGAEAWEILQKEDAPRLAILDWMMPGLTGPEVCELVRKQRRETYTYILLLTSRNEREDLIKGMEAGADDYLVKPFDNSELKVRLGPGQRILQLQAELIHAKELLHEQATRDSLTRLWNRHAIFDVLNREMSRCRREGTGLGVVMGDLDLFKHINDTHGHVAGDAVLREVSARMASMCRSYDAVGRYGGEEFLVLLPGCDLMQAKQKAEALRDKVRESAVKTGAGEIGVTISFGVTALPKGVESDPERLVKAADIALYQAKQNGRDRCECLAFDYQRI